MSPDDSCVSSEKRSGHGCDIDHDRPGLRIAWERQTGCCCSMCTTEITQQEELTYADDHEMVDGSGVDGRSEHCLNRNIIGSTNAERGKTAAGISSSGAAYSAIC